MALFFAEEVTSKTPSLSLRLRISAPQRGPSWCVFGAHLVRLGAYLVRAGFCG